MGYNVHWSGGLVISPTPLPKEIKRIEEFIHKEHASTVTPSMYCPWTIVQRQNQYFTTDISEYQLEIHGEKAHSVGKWLKILISRRLKPYNLKVTGTMTWDGEDPLDFGKLKVIENKITVIKPTITWDEETL